MRLSVSGEKYHRAGWLDLTNPDTSSQPLSDSSKLEPLYDSIAVILLLFVIVLSYMLAVLRLEFLEFILEPG